MTNVIALASARAARQKGVKAHPVDDLSFMARRVLKGTGCDYWKVESTGNYTGDCAMGRKLAKEYLAYIGEHPTNGNATLLGCIVNDMMSRVEDRGRLGGIEIAFLATVNESAMGWSALIAGRLQ
jgi:hypothetical protein